MLSQIKTKVQSSVGILPTKCPSCGSKLRWTATKVDLVCANERCGGRHGQNVVSFFKTLGVEDVAEGTVEHLIDAGLDTVAKIMHGATSAHLMKLEKYQLRKAEIVAKAVAGAMKNVPMAKVMHASGIFSEDAHSLGSTRLQAIIDAVGDGMLRRGRAIELRAKLAKVVGLGPNSLELFLDHLDEWRKFYGEIEKFHTAPSGPKTLAGMVCAFTGFRDPQMESYIVVHGGRVAGVSKFCKVLFAASVGSVKTKKADEMQIPIVAQADAWKWLKSRGE